MSAAIRDAVSQRGCAIAVGPDIVPASLPPFLDADDDDFLSAWTLHVIRNGDVDAQTTREPSSGLVAIGVGLPMTIPEVMTGASDFGDCCLALSSM